MLLLKGHALIVDYGVQGVRHDRCSQQASNFQNFSAVL